MANTPRPLIAGNWKMNGLRHGARIQVDDLLERMAGADLQDRDILLCPPATLIDMMVAARHVRAQPLLVGGQDCHTERSGAHTGDISAEMLKDAGCEYVIVGHSERRADHGEDNDTVRRKARAAIDAGLTAIICIGETENQRQSGETLQVLTGQLEGSVPEGADAANTVIAYEPVWAIGTGLTPTTEDVAEAHAHIRETIGGLIADAPMVRLLYGGSVKPSNAAELLAVENVDGALVGGASLKAADFWAIVTAI